MQSGVAARAAIAEIMMPVRGQRSSQHMRQSKQLWGEDASQDAGLKLCVAWRGLLLTLAGGSHGLHIKLYHAHCSSWLPEPSYRKHPYLPRYLLLGTLYVTTVSGPALASAFHLQRIVMLTVSHTKSIDRMGQWMRQPMHRELYALLASSYQTYPFPVFPSALLLDHVGDGNLQWCPG